MTTAAVPVYDDLFAARTECIAACGTKATDDLLRARGLLLQAHTGFMRELRDRRERIFERAGSPKKLWWSQYIDLAEFEFIWHVELSVHGGRLYLRAKRPAEAVPDYDVPDRYLPPLSTARAPGARSADQRFVNPDADAKEFLESIRLERAARQAARNTYLQLLTDDERTLLEEVETCFPDYKRLKIEPYHFDVLSMFFSGRKDREIANFLRSVDKTLNGDRTHPEKVIEKLLTFVDPFAQSDDYVNDVRRRRAATPRRA